MDQELTITYTKLVAEITKLPEDYKNTLIQFLVTENFDQKQTQQFLEFMADLESRKKAH